MYACEGGETIAAAGVCDQIFDCPNADDELACPSIACEGNADCGPDFKCAWGYCAPLLGSVPAGGACSFPEWFADDCDADTACYEGVCVTDCQSWADCGVSQACNPDTQLCEFGCDPIGNNCPDGQGCTFFPPYDFYCAEGVGVGEPCGDNAFCSTGLCILGTSYAGCAGEYCCAPFCELASGVPCEAPNGICYEADLNDAAEGLGVCGIG